MSDNKDNGGPAFPFILQGPRIDGDSEGMTLRDYFAAKAMHGLVSASVAMNVNYDEDVVAKSAYKMADEMLKAREQ